MVATWYIAECQGCKPILKNPYGSEAERDKFAHIHGKNTGHAILLWEENGKHERISEARMMPLYQEHVVELTLRFKMRGALPVGQGIDAVSKQVDKMFEEQIKVGDANLVIDRPTVEEIRVTKR